MVALPLNYISEKKSPLIFAGFGVLVYQLAIYPFLAKYFGPIKPFRPAVVREKYIFCVLLHYTSCNKKNKIVGIRWVTNLNEPNKMIQSCSFLFKVY
jgi:hypothetical protein